MIRNGWTGIIVSVEMLVSDCVAREMRTLRKNFSKQTQLFDWEDTTAAIPLNCRRGEARTASKKRLQCGEQSGVVDRDRKRLLRVQKAGTERNVKKRMHLMSQSQHRFPSTGSPSCSQTPTASCRSSFRLDGARVVREVWDAGEGEEGEAEAGHRCRAQDLEERENIRLIDQMCQRMLHIEQSTKDQRERTDFEMRKVAGENRIEKGSWLNETRDEISQCRTGFQCFSRLSGLIIIIITEPLP